MNYFKEILYNFPLISAIFGWFLAQLIKFIIELAECKKPDFSLFVSSGGMPSSHSSSVCALATAIAIEYGFSSPLFSIAFILGLIVMYDAMGVRRETGKQAEILNNLVKDIMDYKPEYFQKDLKELIGHTPFQVLCGAFLGVLTPFIVQLFYM